MTPRDIITGLRAAGFWPRLPTDGHEFIPTLPAPGTRINLRAAIEIDADLTAQHAGCIAFLRSEFQPWQPARCVIGEEIDEMLESGDYDWAAETLEGIRDMARRAENTNPQSDEYHDQLHIRDLLGSVAYRAVEALRADQSGAITDPTQNGKQAIGIPHLRSIVNADYLIPNYERLSIQGSWTYSSGKPIDMQNTMQAPSYNKFDAGLKYLDRVGKAQATYRVFVENIFNKFYWRDVSQSFGANMLYPGAPRIIRATANFDF